MPGSALRSNVTRGEALGRREPRRLDAALDHPPLAIDQLQLDQAGQELDVILAFCSTLAGELVVFPQEGRQLQGLEVVGQQQLRRIGHDIAPVSNPMYELADVVATSARGK